MVKTYKSLDELLCISDCSRVDKCKLITFNKLSNICKYYRYYLLNETTLIESNGDFVYNYQVNRYTYQLQGIEHRSFYPGCAVYTLTLLPNGNLATGCQFGNIIIWDTTSWTRFLTLTRPNQPQPTYSVIIQNEYLAIGRKNGDIDIWDFKNGELKKTLYGHNDSINSILSLSNNDYEIVSGSVDSKIIIWNTIDWSVKSKISLMTGSNVLIQLKNGTIVVFDWYKNGFLLWNPFTGLTRTISDSDLLLGIVLLENNGDLIFATYINTLKIYDSSSLKLKQILVGHPMHIRSIIQLKNNDLVTTCDSFIKVWDWNTKTIRYNFAGNSGQVWNFVELPNGYLVSTGLDMKIIVWK